MRILAGTIKNKLIPSIKSESYRPTASFLREAIFNILRSLQIDIKESRVLDAFAGTGSLAFEALSRGAQSATLLDINPKYIKSGREFILQNNLNAKYALVDSTKLPEANQKYNLVFLDPPYQKNILLLALESLLNKGWLEIGAIIVAELPCAKDVFKAPEYFLTLKDKQYRSTRLLIMKAIY
jgi:16S rRNA (guanine966-N2)-methyltransferase